METIRSISQAIQDKALRLGFADCGFSRAEALPGDAERLRKWLEKGCQSRMSYMSNHYEKRTDPRLLVEGARSVISLLFNYYTQKKQVDSKAPVLSKYAYGRDYHFVLKEKMNLLFDFIKSEIPGTHGRIFVDSAPVLDRAWARKSGLGWIGKNSLLISRKAGSFVFIGEIILNAELEYNKVPEGDFCGSCSRCIEACPTQAILDNRTLDSEKCISYQTIENKSAISAELKGKLAGRVFGCDICQDVCPWNRNASDHSEPDFEPAPGLLEMSAKDWDSMDRNLYTQLFSASPVKRAGFDKLKGTLAFFKIKSI